MFKPILCLNAQVALYPNYMRYH